FDGKGGNRSKWWRPRFRRELPFGHGVRVRTKLTQHKLRSNRYVRDEKDISRAVHMQGHGSMKRRKKPVVKVSRRRRIQTSNSTVQIVLDMEEHASIGVDSYFSEVVRVGVRNLPQCHIVLRRLQSTNPVRVVVETEVHVSVGIEHKVCWISHA